MLTERVIELIIQAVIAVVLIVMMTWIVVSPANDEATKAALVVVSSAVGFLFGRNAGAAAHTNA